MTESPSAERMAELQKQLPHGQLRTCRYLPAADTNSKGVLWMNNQATAYIDGKHSKEVVVVAQHGLPVVEFYAAASRYDYAGAAEDKATLSAQADEIKRLRGALETMKPMFVYLASDPNGSIAETADKLLRIHCEALAPTGETK